MASSRKLALAVLLVAMIAGAASATGNTSGILRIKTILHSKSLTARAVGCATTGLSPLPPLGTLAHEQILKV
jgi:hypothetical protein